MDEERFASLAARKPFKPPKQLPSISESERNKSKEVCSLHIREQYLKTAAKQTEPSSSLRCKGADDVKKSSAVGSRRWRLPFVVPKQVPGSIKAAENLPLKLTETRSILCCKSTIETAEQPQLVLGSNTVHNSKKVARHEILAGESPRNSPKRKFQEASVQSLQNTFKKARDGTAEQKTGADACGEIGLTSQLVSTPNAPLSHPWTGSNKKSSSRRIKQPLKQAFSDAAIRNEESNRLRNLWNSGHDDTNEGDCEAIDLSSPTQPAARDLGGAGDLPDCSQVPIASASGGHDEFLARLEPQWWRRLPDFVPVSELKNGYNPRTGAAVHIDYAKQFVETAESPPAKGKRARGKGQRSQAGKKSQGGNRKGSSSGKRKFWARKPYSRR